MIGQQFDRLPLKKNRNEVKGNMANSTASSTTTAAPIIGLFNNRDMAERAYQALFNYGYTQDEITIHPNRERMARPRQRRSDSPIMRQHLLPFERISRFVAKQD